MSKTHKPKAAKSEQEVRRTFTITEEILEELKFDAFRNDRSTDAQLRCILRDYYGIK